VTVFNSLSLRRHLNYHLGIRNVAASFQASTSKSTAERQMGKKIFRVLLISAGAAMLALPVTFADSAFPKTASCPIDGAKAHATGKKRTATQTACTEIEYKHKGTDYSDPRHPQKFNHLFWITHCSE